MGSKPSLYICEKSLHWGPSADLYKKKEKTKEEEIAFQSFQSLNLKKYQALLHVPPSST